MKPPAVLLAVMLTLGSLGAPALKADVSQELTGIQERLFGADASRPVFQDADIYERDLVAAFYQANDYRAVWSDPGYVEEVLGLLEASAEEGLNPQDYHLRTLHALRSIDRDTLAEPFYLQAKFDLLLTDAVLAYARHLVQGKVDPRTLDESWNYSRIDYAPARIVTALREAIASREVAALLNRLKPDYAVYRQMKAALREYRALALAEPFHRIPDETTLRPGMSHANVPALRRRLAQLGYLEGQAPDSPQYGAALEQAVRQFQGDNNLDVDGVVGRHSFELLNLSFADRVERIRINLDRLRWMSDEVSDEFILVNVAGYELYYLRNGRLLWETPVMIGAIETQTPIFQAPLRYLEFNPSWNVPRSIVSRSLFAGFRAEPRSVIDKGYQLFDPNGQPIDPLTLDWTRFTADSFPYRVVQQPGPGNAMGRVKFMFPNPHAVYLHDTPSRSLFSRKQRAFSAGCIRVEDPLELARLLLDDPVTWSAQEIQALVEGGRPRQIVHIRRPVDVLLTYLTVSPAPGGQIQFHRDVYQRDPATLEALYAPPQVREYASRGVSGSPPG